jgi:hypothetical protein
MYDDAMRVRIVKQIPAPRLEGFDVAAYQCGAVYEVGRSLCEILLAYGYAAPETGISVTLSTANDAPIAPTRSRSKQPDARKNR